MKSNKYLIILFASTTLLAILVEMITPKSINWEFSFSKNDKIPYGSYILHQILPDLFPNQKIIVAHQSAYEVLSEQTHHPESSLNYIFINHNFAPDETSLNQLLDFVGQGNTVFIAASQFDPRLADTLKISISYNFFETADQAANINFTNRNLKSKPAYAFKIDVVDSYFERCETEQSVYLGEDGKRQPNYLKVPFGEGAFYLHALPLIFTNYHLLDAIQAEYIYTALSYLPVQTTIWDEYYKVGRQEIATPLRYILSVTSLRWAYYLTILSTFIFVISAGKRRQRIIPVINPLINTTLEFARTVGRLYYQQRDHANIATKKATYFLEHLRSAYYLDTAKLDDPTCRKVAAHSGVSLSDVRDLFRLLKRIERHEQFGDQDIFALEKGIARFYQN